MTSGISGERLNEFVESGCDGFLVADASMVAGYIIDLLRSGHEIREGARLALADAIERGRGNGRAVEYNGEGQEMPRIVVEGVGWNGLYAQRLAVRRKWMSAAEAFGEACDAGTKSNDELRLTIGDRYDLQLEAMRKALAFHKRFLIEYDTPGNPLVAEAGEDLEQEHPDFYGHCRNIFIEREARKSMPPEPANAD